MAKIFIIVSGGMVQDVYGDRHDDAVVIDVDAEKVSDASKTSNARKYLELKDAISENAVVNIY